MPADIRLFYGELREECVEMYISVFNSPPWNERWTKESAEERLRELTRNPSFVGFAVTKSERAVGYAFCCANTWWSRKELHIEHIFVANEEQGKGYGKALLDGIEAYMRENDIHGLNLLTNRNLPCAAFYEKNGFYAIDQLRYFGKRI